MEKEELKWRPLARDSVEFRGHPMVRSAHATTIEVTTEEYLTENGDCIIGVGASKGCAQLDPDVKQALRTPGAKVQITISAGGRSFVVWAEGDPKLELSDVHDMVIRTSDFISGRTLAIRADAAARNIPREIVRTLKDKTSTGTMVIEVRTP